MREIVVDPVRCPLDYEEFRLKEFERDRDGSRVDEITDGNDHSFDAVRYAVMDDVMRGAQALLHPCPVLLLFALLHASGYGTYLG